MSYKILVHLKLSIGCNDGCDEHPEVIMKKLGITYQHATPQSIADQWWFWNCENVPNPLPEYLTFLNADPKQMIKFGLSKEDAQKISDYKFKHQNKVVEEAERLIFKLSGKQNHEYDKEYLIEDETSNDWHIAELGAKTPAKRLKCSKCGGTEFNIAHELYWTAVKCPRCGWEHTIHDG